MSKCLLPCCTVFTIYCIRDHNVLSLADMVSQDTRAMVRSEKDDNMIVACFQPQGTLDPTSNP